MQKTTEEAVIEQGRSLNELAQSIKAPKTEPTAPVLNLLDEVALKYDGEKERVDLIPPLAILEVGDVFGYGAAKYRPYNYLYGGGMAFSRMIGAALRHILQFMGGEDRDQESGKSHLAHAIATLLMLRETQLRCDDKRDDRIHKEIR